MSKTLELAKDLISRQSNTPEDAGCQELMISRLEPLGFKIERMRSILNPSDSRREIISSWQPASSGVLDWREIRSFASSRVLLMIVAFYFRKFW